MRRTNLSCYSTVTFLRVPSTLLLMECYSAPTRGFRACVSTVEARLCSECKLQCLAQPALSTLGVVVSMLGMLRRSQAQVWLSLCIAEEVEVAPSVPNPSLCVLHFPAEGCVSERTSVFNHVQSGRRAWRYARHRGVEASGRQRIMSLRRAQFRGPFNLGIWDVVSVSELQCTTLGEQQRLGQQLIV